MYSQEIPECVYLPTNQNCRVVGIVTTSGMPMQSAARVPILVSFEVEDYPGPDHDAILAKTGFVLSLSHTEGFDDTQRKTIAEALGKFSQFWAPIHSEEDVHDDEFDITINENQFEEHLSSEVKASTTKATQL